MKLSPGSHDVIRDALRALIALGIVASTTVLGIRGVLDAAAVTGIFGAAIGVVGGATAVAVTERIRNGNTERNGGAR